MARALVTLEYRYAHRSSGKWASIRKASRIHPAACFLPESARAPRSLPRLAGTGRRTEHPAPSNVARSISPMRRSSCRAAFYAGPSPAPEIGQLIVVPWIVDARCKLGVLPQGPLPLVFEQCVERRRFRDRRGIPCASRRGWRQEQRREKHATIMRMGNAVLTVNCLTGRDLQCTSLSIPDARYASIGARPWRSFRRSYGHTELVRF